MYGFFLIGIHGDELAEIKLRENGRYRLLRTTVRISNQLVQVFGQTDWLQGGDFNDSFYYIGRIGVRQIDSFGLTRLYDLGVDLSKRRIGIAGLDVYLLPGSFPIGFGFDDDF